jgi:hypothetical protein
VEGTLSRLFLRRILDQQVVQAANGQGTLRIPLMITDDIMKAVEVDPSAETDRNGLTTENTGKQGLYGK